LGQVLKKQQIFKRQRNDGRGKKKSNSFLCRSFPCLKILALILPWQKFSFVNRRRKIQLAQTSTPIQYEIRIPFAFLLPASSAYPLPPIRHPPASSRLITKNGGCFLPKAALC